jgi:large subunit ribosomal protein L9
MEYKKHKVREQATHLSAKLEALSIVLAHQAGEGDKLFGAVTNMEIAEYLKKHEIQIDRKKIVLAEPIKHLGEFTATVKIHPEVTATLKITVTPL